jgi:phosphopantothenoylcysteine decarboxylase/phosphopantothenate--cysteine ligase
MCATNFQSLETAEPGKTATKNVPRSHDTFMSAEENKTILLGICGGIAAYKAVEVASRLRKSGHEIHVAMSPAAQKFVTPLTFAAISGNAVLTEQFPDPSKHAGDALYPHLYPSTRAELFVLLPATADMIAKIAHGLGDDVVSTAALSLPASCRRVLCPSMNVEMWRQPVVRENIRILESRGWIRVGPSAGELACGMTGEGRMAEPDEILGVLLAAPPAELSGKRILIISGPTHEHFDPVRFIGNPSSGKMGAALAEEAIASGATVTFVSGPVAESNLPRGANLEIHPVVSADEMFATAQKFYSQADVVIYAAAVADYKPAKCSEQKLPKKSGAVDLKLVATPDVSATLNKKKRPGQVCIGFALQTDDGEAKAREKLERKDLDGIVLNALDALGGDSGEYRFLAARGKNGFARWGKISKRDCAKKILAEVARISSASNG